MPERQPKQMQISAGADIIDLDSGDEEDYGVYQRKNDVASMASGYQTLDNRSFWKAGDYKIGSTKFTTVQGDLEHARVHPKFLHSNATTHKWAFGAIAEILDNAVDEISNGATFVKVDRIYNLKDNSPALLFQDDGGGMDPESLRKCMSLGYSSKKSDSAIGQYGNGFKTSTMRLGADVIVFSCAAQSGRATQSVGLLSYTFLRKTGQDDVIVPMIDFDVSGNRAEPIFYATEDDWCSNLKTIVEWSPFSSMDDLLLQFDDIGSHGTKIIIYNMWMNDVGVYELTFDDDEEDIRLRDEANHGNVSRPSKKALELQSHLSYRIRYSLRAYASVLYLRKFAGFRIILRGKQLEQFIIAEDLKHSKIVTYTPQVGPTAKEVAVETHIGFIKEAPAIGVCGFNVYHRNRLIMPFWKVTQDGSRKGQGVVGVLEANFIEPVHDKQDFERSNLFTKLESRLKQMVNEYWKSHCHLIGQLPDGFKRSVPQQSHDTKAEAEEVVSQNAGRIGVNYESAKILDADSGSNSETSTEVLASVDEICEENIKLFMRCEEFKGKHSKKSELIQQREKQLEEMRKKCAGLSNYLEVRRCQTEDL